MPFRIDTTNPPTAAASIEHLGQLHMFSSNNNQTVEVSLNVPVRTLDAIRGDKVHSRFVAGSCSIDEGSNNNSSNHLHVLRYHTQANELRVDAILPHPTGPVAGIVTNPSDASVVLTYADDAKTATLWKLPNNVQNRADAVTNDYNDDDDDDVPPLTTDMEQTVSLEMKSPIVDMVWRDTNEEEAPPSGGNEGGDVVTLDMTGTISQWDISSSAATSSRHLKVPSDDSRWNLPPQMAWDPHNHDNMTVASGTKVHLVDWRANNQNSSTSESIPCHKYGITDLDYNPNKPHVLTTAGQDGLLKFWDLRFLAKQPLLISRGGHRHWVSRVSYNPFHDQLVLSAGTDSLVNLWRFSSISSAPILSGAFEENENNPAEEDALAAEGPNVRVAQHEHMDSVYAVAWGAADAWVYASVGYDGRAILSQVPSKEKYKILL
eukprot:scaffold1736_cov127-Cylindrotheca_fusiformis.AAC.69